MSDATPSDAPHEGPIKTPKQLVVAVVLAFVVPIAIIVLLVSYVGSEHKPGAGSDLKGAQEVAERIHPIGTVEVKDASDAGSLKTGEQVYAAVCVSCHGAGTLGAPKFGDAEAWTPRLKTGYAALLNSALHGKNAMPAQGGGDFGDVEIGRAVVYMANKAGAAFEEPKAATATAAASAPAAGGSAAAAQAEQAAQAVAAATANVPAAAAEGSAGGSAPPALYAQVCQACHAAGVAGAPKIGDKAAWAPRIAQGVDTLTQNAIHGKGMMPPKGGSTASDADIKAVVAYMVSAAK